ncbi:MAG: hypothetical protein LBT60_02760 [Oscillospiraceae bacterium]|nr:hypothetical protein [Oscillospiraceae bacterium]
MTFRRFSHWWRNSFWFHYKWHSLGVLALLALLALIFTEVLGRVHPDLYYTATLKGIGISTSFDELDAHLLPLMEDLNGDGQIVLQSELLGVDESEIGMAVGMKFTIQLLDDNISLFLLDRATADELAEQSDAFLPMADFGLTGEADEPWLLRVDDKPMLSGIPVLEGRPFYACVKVFSPAEWENPDIRARFDQIGVLLRAMAGDG